MVSSFLEIVQQLSFVMTTPTFASFVTILTGWVLARRQNSTGHLGFEKPRGRTRRAVERTGPTAMPLYSLTMLWLASTGHGFYRVPFRPSYGSKIRASFGDILVTQRQESVGERVSSLRLTGRGSRNILKSMIHAIKQAPEVGKSN